ncbi:MAG: aminotransferase class I/II-fold pyridoxal phosphate-dependent enzyme [Acidobacteriota bacterium]
MALDAQLVEAARQRLSAARERSLDLDMTRGKPSAHQLDLALPMLDLVTASDFTSASGVDCRNYGGGSGLDEARTLFAPYFDVAAEEIFVLGNSSLQLMYDVLLQAVLRGVPGGSGPWSGGKILAPSPGYDRHFHLADFLGFEVVPVPMTDHGPDMEAVARLTADDESVRAIFCVPRYSNPTGCVYSEETVRALAAMKTAAPDFRIVWDNAYSVHHLVDEPVPLANLLRECESAGHADRALMFGSTSKISFAGAGVSLFSASEANRGWFAAHLTSQTIGPDKLNQLRHVRFFGDWEGVESHMRKHADLLRPKFAAVGEVLDERLRDTGVAEWTKPEGGYFISVDGAPGTASKVAAMAREIGVKLTPAGATFPYGEDPEDRNLRVAPSFPSVDSLVQATEVLSDCLLVAAAEA